MLMRVSLYATTPESTGMSDSVKSPVPSEVLPEGQEILLLIPEFRDAPVPIVRALVRDAGVALRADRQEVQGAPAERLVGPRPVDEMLDRQEPLREDALANRAKVAVALHDLVPKAGWAGDDGHPTPPSLGERKAHPSGPGRIPYTRSSGA